MLGVSVGSGVRVGVGVLVGLAEPRRAVNTARNVGRGLGVGVAHPAKQRRNRKPKRVRVIFAR